MRLSLPMLFFKMALPALLVVVLYGWVERRQVWTVLVVGILWRWLVLFQEHRKPVMTEASWQNLRQAMIQRQKALLEASTETQAEAASKIDDEADDHLAILKKHYQPPRPRDVLMAEALALPVFLLALPVLMLMTASDFFTFSRGFRWQDMMAVASCAVLFALPHLRFFRAVPAFVTKAWWLAPVFLVPLAILGLVRDKHPYWNPFHPDQHRLAAEKVLSLQDWVLAADHAEWLLTHAEDLAGQGKTTEAKELCAKAMQMQPSSARGSRLLVRLGGKLPDAAPENDPLSPYLPDGTPIPRAERCLLETAHGTLPDCTIVLVPVGDVPEQDLDFVAEVLRRETGMPAKVYEKKLPLPEPTRKPGLLSSPQWHLDSIVMSVLPEINGRRVRGPLKILVVTSADIYRESANYIFAAGYPWGGVISEARFTFGGNPWLTRHRLAKQCYSILIKSFDIAPSTDQRCVTSYPNGLAAFDAKGNRPLPEVRQQFLEKLAALNRGR